MEKQRKDVPKWLWAIVISLFILSMIGAYVEGGSFGVGSISVGWFIVLGCAYKCSKWAKEINSNIILAFFIGFFLGLLGLLFYYIYYKVKRKKK